MWGRPDQLGKAVDAAPTSPYVCVLLRAGETVGVDVFRRADLRKAEAAANYRQALSLAKSPAERRYLERRLTEVGDAEASKGDVDSSETPIGGGG